MSAHAKANGSAGPAVPVEIIEELPPVTAQDATAEPVDPDFVPQTISLRLTEGMVGRLRVAAAAQGARGYQTLIKSILRSWLAAHPFADVSVDEPELESESAPQRPLRSKRQLLAALKEAVARRKEAQSCGAAEEVEVLSAEIEQIKDDLADLENEGI